jgi:hypothetical protein
LTIQRKCLNPYRSYRFSLASEKINTNKNSLVEVVIVVSELDLPPLKIDFSGNVLTS